MAAFRYRSIRRAVVRGCLLLALAWPATAHAGDFTYSTQEQLLADATAAPCANEDRLAAATALFKSAGATDADIAVVSYGNVSNLVVTLKGDGPGFIVVGAHYDKVKAGCGAVDNWTGVVLVAHAFRTLRQATWHKTILFVAFGGEEAGLKGSHAMVKAIAGQDRASYCAMVNLDSFGLSIPQILDNASTPKLRAFVVDVAAKAKIRMTTASLQGIADADSSSFKSSGIPAVTLHALTADWAQILHSSHDQAALIKSGSLYLGYVLTLRVLSSLDACDCGAFR